METEDLTSLPDPTPQQLSAGTPHYPHLPIVDRAIRVVQIAGSLIAIGAMLLLALRAALRLELRWDTFMYHIPFAARRAGLAVSYELLPTMQNCYEGFPPLPELLQGVLWRLTGSINATGVINYLALELFLYFCWRYLKVWLWLTVILGLTAPLVLIHAASSYIDLFANAFLAIRGMHLTPEAPTYSMRAHGGLPAYAGGV